MLTSPYLKIQISKAVLYPYNITPFEILNSERSFASWIHVDPYEQTTRTRMDSTTTWSVFRRAPSARTSWLTPHREITSSSVMCNYLVPPNCSKSKQLFRPQYPDSILRSCSTQIELLLLNRPFRWLPRDLNYHTKFEYLIISCLPNPRSAVESPPSLNNTTTR